MEKRNKTPARRRYKAGTKEVLGVAAHPPQIDPKWQKHYQRLIELREKLLNQRVDLANDAMSERPKFSQHMGDAGTDTYDRDLALGMLSSEQDAIYEIEEAIDRIQNNAYGICELTGKPIDARRLEAVPWTRFSKEAETELEQQGAVKRARLNPRSTVVRETATKDPEEG